MKVVVARTAGFCWGVRRAMDAVLEASSRQDGPVRTLGPLIHNPQALALIARRGVSVVDYPEDVSDGTVLIRAHGIPIQQLRDLKQREKAGELKLLNATCPEVAKVHSRIKKWSPKGYFTVILGSHAHAESIAHQSFAENGSVIVSTMAEAEALTDEQLQRVLVVAQTTFTTQAFHAITTYLRERAGDIIVENTICEDTWTRQEEAHQIARSVDAVVVVGGKNSANTRHLVELAEHHGRPVQYVETASELDLQQFQGKDSVGVLAGASTPTWLVEEVVDVLEGLKRGPSRLIRSFRKALETPLLLGAGAFCLSIGLHRWLGLPWSAPYSAMAGLYVTAMFLLAPFTDPMGLDAKGPARGRLLKRASHFVMPIGIVCLVASLTLAAYLGWGSFIALLGASASGLLYRQKFFAGSKSFSLQGIPGSKDLVVSLAMAVVVVAIPMWHNNAPWHAKAWLGLGFAASMAFAHSVIHNIRDMQNDQMLGRETLPILVGRSATKILLTTILGAVLLGGLLATPWGTLRHPWIPAVVMPLATLYPIFFLWFSHERFRTGNAMALPPLELAMFSMSLLAFA